MLAVVAMRERLSGVSLGSQVLINTWIVKQTSPPSNFGVVNHP
jgi:hypothetical protein